MIRNACAYLENVGLVAVDVGDGYNDIAQKVDQYNGSKQSTNATCTIALKHEDGDDDGT